MAGRTADLTGDDLMIVLLKRDAVRRTITEHYLGAALPKRMLAVARLHEFLADPATDLEEMESLILLARLLPAQTDRAAARYAEVEGSTAAATATAFAELGPQCREQAVARLAGIARDPHSGRWDARGAARTLLAFGPQHHGLARELMDGLLARGVSIGLLGTPLTRLDEGFVPHAAELALGSLLLDPHDPMLLTERGQGEQDDVVSVVLAAGEQYREPVRRTLWQLVEDPERGADLRWKAAARLALLGEPERARAEQALLDAGVPDPKAPPERVALSTAEAAAARAEVASVWAAIEAYLAEHAPAVLDRLGGPASAEELAEAERQLGFDLPLDFAASCLIHRSVAVEGDVFDRVNHVDLGELAAMRDTEDTDWTSSRPDTEFRQDWGWRPGWILLDRDPDGSPVALDLDPASAGRYGQVGTGEPGALDTVVAPDWLTVLRRFAANLADGRYRYDAAAGTLHDDDC